MGRMIIQNKTHNWKVEGVGNVPGSEELRLFGYTFVKQCDLSGALVYYDEKDWHCIGVVEDV